MRLLALTLSASLCLPGLAALGAPALEVLQPNGDAIAPGAWTNALAWGFNGEGQTTISTSLGAVRAVAAGGTHTVLLKADGKVAIRGKIHNGTKYVTATVPTGLSGVVAIAAGANHTVALKQNGTVADWGYVDDGARYAAPSVPKGLSGVVAIAAGSYHTVALKQDGSVVAWGRNYEGQTNVPAGLSGVVAIAAGRDHTVALKQDGSVVAWGRNYSGQTNVPAGLSGVVAIAAGERHTVALKQDGRVVAWGRNYSGQTNVPAGLSGVVAIAAGYSHTVALKQDGGVVAWGHNYNGQTNVPAGLSGVVAIAAGGSHTVALKADSRDFGTVNVGQTSPSVSLRLRNSGNAPLSLKSATLVGGQAADFLLDKTALATALAAGDGTALSLAFKPRAAGVRRTTLRITTNDPARPRFDIPLLGIGKLNKAPVVSGQILWVEATDLAGTPVDLRLRVQDIGEMTALTLDSTPTSGSLFPLGDTSVTLTATDSAGLSSTGSFIVRVQDTSGPVFTSFPAAIEVPATSHLGAVVDYPAAEASDVLPVTLSYSQASGSVFPIGTTVVEVHATDANGRVTTRSFSVYVAPASASIGVTPVLPTRRSDVSLKAWGYNYYGQTNVPAGLSGVVAIAAGYAHTVALKQDGSVVAWGRNNYGQTKVPAGLSSVVAIAAGGYHNVALKQDGSVVAWGYNYYGQTNVPAGLSGVVAIAAGYAHTVALKQDGSVVAWGDNYSGQNNVPAGLSGVVAIAAGTYHTVALKQDGSVVAWGYNSSGQTTVPAGLTGVVAIAASDSHTVALKQDGSVVAWGDNLYGQTTVPAGLSGVVAIAAGGYHTVALKQDGSVVAWGYNYEGQTNVPAGLSGVVAIAAGGYHTVALTGRLLQRDSQLIVGRSTPMGSIALTNTGTAPLLIESAVLAGIAAADYEVSATLPASLAAGEVMNLNVNFAPKAPGARTATLQLLTNTAANPLEFFFSANAVANTAPVIKVPNSPLLVEATGPDGAIVNFTASVTDANESVLPELVLSHASGSRFPLGNTTVTATATDPGGLTTQKSFIVRVADLTAPAIAALPNISVPQDSAAGTVVTYTPATATDAVGVTSLTYSHPSGGLFPPGATTVTVTARDAAGNIGTRTFNVTVGVVLSVPSGIVTAEATSAQGATVTFSTGLASGSAPAATGPTAVPPSGSAFPIGDTPVSVTATDANGFTSTANFTVRVRDTTAPSLTVPANVSLPADRPTGALVTYPNATATDTVGVSSITYSTPSGSVFPVGTTTVTVIARDQAGNQTSRSFSVTVAAPVAKLEITREGSSTQEMPVVPKIAAWGSNGYGQTTVPAGLRGVVAIAAGYSHTVALKQDGSVVAWGANNPDYNNYGQTNVPAGLSGVVAIAAGYEHTVALKQDGSVVAWGSNSYGKTNVPAGLSGVVAIAAGYHHTVALKQDGSVVAWGYNYSGQTNVPAGLSGVVAIAAGGSHTVALKQDGSVVAWGSNSYGQTNVPAGLSGVVAIAAGYSHTVALKQDGSVVAWGAISNDYGQTNVPAGLSGVVAIAAGGSHTVALKQDGSVVAWGSNSYGQTNVPAGLSGVVAIAAGGSHTVALRARPPIAFGNVNAGQSAERTIRLRSMGVVNASGLSATLVAPSAEDFSVVGDPLPSVLAGGESAEVKVRFIAGATGERRAWLRITSNDPNFDPYLVPLTATATAPEIEVESPASLADGATVSLGTVPILAPALTRSFTIRNSGDCALEDLALTLDGDAAADFTVSTLGATQLPPGGQQTFTVTFAPSEAGLRSAVLHIASNDSDENPFDILLSGQGSSLDISFAGEGGTRLTRPVQGIDLGNIDDRNIVERSFTVRNTGTQTLTGFRLDITGADASQFTVTPALPGTLSPGDSFTFTLRFTPNSRGLNRTTIVRLLTDQADEEAVELRFTATVRAAQLVVRDSAGRVVESPSQGNAVVAWGDNYSGQTNVPAGLSGVVAIAAGGSHTVALKQDGSVVAWGHNYKGQTTVPAGLSGVVAIAAGGYHTVALKQDGTVVAWGYNYSGQTNVPAGLSGVVAIAAGRDHTVALKQDGSVVAWGYNYSGQTNVPADLSGVVAIAAGYSHTVALKQDGSVVAWGAISNDYGQTNVPAGLSGVVAIAAGGEHTVALKQDGSVVAWGRNDYGQTNVPAGLTGVVAIAAGYYHTVALKQDGVVVAWGANNLYYYNYYGQTTVPAGLSGVVAIAAGYSHTVALVEPAGNFGHQQLGTIRPHTLTLNNPGSLSLNVSSITLEGQDADQFSLVGSLSLNVSSITLEGQDAGQFSLVGSLPGSIPIGGSAPLTLRFVPTRIGEMTARLRLFSNDPDTPECVIELKGIRTYEIDSQSTKVGGPLNYAPLRLDRTTGMILQTVTFTNPTGLPLHGLRLTLSQVADGVQIYSSSAGLATGTFDVIYSNPIAVGETISFDLVYADPKRRTSAAIQPIIRAAALEQPEPDSPPVAGAAVPLRSLRVTPQGPLLEWNAVRNAVYVVEYSDDGGTAWFSAVHLLGTTSTRMLWIDRGQPETKTKPTGVPNQSGGRYYRVKRL